MQSSLVVSFSLAIQVLLKAMSLTFISSLISPEAHEGHLLNASVSSMSFPGLYLIVTSYAVAEVTSSRAWVGHLQGSSDVSCPVACGLTPLWIAFWGHMYWTSDKWIQWPKVPFWCLHTWSQCLWGACWQRQLVGLPVVYKLPVLFGRHWPVLPQALFCHSIWVAGKLFWQLSPLSSGNCHLPFDASRRLCPASALSRVALCDEGDVVQSSPCMSPFQWNWPAVASLLWAVSFL